MKNDRLPRVLARDTRRSSLVNLYSYEEYTPIGLLLILDSEQIVVEHGIIDNLHKYA